MINAEQCNNSNKICFAKKIIQSKKEINKK